MLLQRGLWAGWGFGCPGKINDCPEIWEQLWKGVEMLIISSWACLPSHRILFRAVWGMNTLSPSHISQLPFWVQEFLFLAPLWARSGQVRGSLNEWMWLSGPVGYQGNLGKLWTLGIMCWNSLCLQEKQYGIEEVVIHQSQAAAAITNIQVKEFPEKLVSWGDRVKSVRRILWALPKFRDPLLVQTYSKCDDAVVCVQSSAAWRVNAGLGVLLWFICAPTEINLWSLPIWGPKVWGLTVAQSSTEPGTRTQQCLNCISKQKARGGRKFLHPHIAQSQRNQGYCSFGEIIKSSVVFQSHGWFFIVNSATCWLKAVCCEQRAGCSTPTIALGSTMCTPTRVFPLELTVSL